MLAFYQDLLFREHFSIPSEKNELQCCFIFSRKVHKNSFQSCVKSPWPLPNLIRYSNFHMWTACITELSRFFLLSPQPCVLFSSVSFLLLSSPLMRRWVPKGKDWWNSRCLWHLCPLCWSLLEVGLSSVEFRDLAPRLHMSSASSCALSSLDAAETGNTGLPDMRENAMVSMWMYLPQAKTLL